MSGARDVQRPEGAVIPLIRLTLMERFVLSAQTGPLSITRGSQRLLAFLAVRREPVRRDQVAGTLWPDVGEERAFASLRSDLWRLQGPAKIVIEVSSRELRLADCVSVDLYESTDLAYRLLASPSGPREVDPRAASIQLLSGELLPGWYEEWALMEAEHWRQLRLHALEALSRCFWEQGHHSHAVEAALSAVAGDPLRESAHRCLIQAHLAEGNQSEALRAFENYRFLLQTELGLEPTERLRQILPVVKTM